MATTTNFGWTTPNDTDLVKDGAAAIRTALNGVDTSFVDLKGGTTGQVLSKTSNTDLDFTWITDATGMTNPMTTTGDVIYSSSGSTPARLGIGTAGQVLQVNSGATAPEWISPAASGLTKISTTTITNTASTDISNIFSATYDRYLIVLEVTAASDHIRFQMQSSGVRDATNYGGAVAGYRYNASGHDFSKTASGDGYLLHLGTATSPGVNGLVQAVISSPFASAKTRITGSFTGIWNAGGFWTAGSFGTTHDVATSYNGIMVGAVSGNMTGTFTVYGMS
jgi:hypothetical protein